MKSQVVSFITYPNQPLVFVWQRDTRGDHSETDHQCLV